ncbi:hypothetical protein TanjilG_24636 [Lupinus angustifolius]|uniref:Uncharacterized protein n=1 Tax=Lupinus angustifolius TaxID=3871 RepID=A0A4P1RKS5_LUPAN|nr:hypothetical protein TanjilG_24636 [Lupinus angustifolius]
MPRCRIVNTGKDAPLEAGAGAGIDTYGGKTAIDPLLASELGGLGLEGIVGNEDSDGEKATPLGVGNSGSISGDSVGPVEMVETCMFCREAEENEQLHAIKDMNIAENSKQKEAIKGGENQLLYDMKSNECVSIEKTELLLEKLRRFMIEAQILKRV